MESACVYLVHVEGLEISSTIWVLLPMKINKQFVEGIEILSTLD